MDKDFGICGRDKEIKMIFDFISRRVEKSKSGLLYLTGPPGTGKTMCVNLVLNKLNNVINLKLNCFKAQTTKSVLAEICEFVGLKGFNKASESEIMVQLEKKLSGRTSKSHVIVLDEMDQLPKSKNAHIFQKMFSWTQQSMSKLIIVGIANTVNMTARCQALSQFLSSSQESNTDKIIFRPYNSKDIKAILNWYLENDENLEEASIDSKALDVISMKFARENGDIRGAINALRSAIEDVAQASHKSHSSQLEQFPTPPSTPPPSPCKEKTTNIASVAGSVRKRQRESHYFEDKAISNDKIILTCLQKFCVNGSVDARTFLGKTTDILHKYKSESSSIYIRSALEQLESQGFIVFKKRIRKTGSDLIVLKASQNEIAKLVPDQQNILNFIENAV